MDDDQLPTGVAKLQALLRQRDQALQVAERQVTELSVTVE